MSTNVSAFGGSTTYNSYFGFLRKPFPTGFDIEFYCTNPCNDIIYNHLVDGIYQHQGVTVLTGDAGTGKTFLLRKLMREATGEVEFVFCNYFVNLDFDDLLSLVYENLGLMPHNSSRPQKLKALSGYLNSCFEKGLSAALLIDEAHNLDEDVSNHLFTLTKSGFKDGRSLQIVLSGLPSLREKLARWKASHPIMADISENRLMPLSKAEVAAFIRQQLQVAGGRHQDLFPEPVIERVAHHTEGIPRSINTLCDRALMMAQVSGQTRLSIEMIDEVANEILLRDSARHKLPESMTVPFVLAATSQPEANNPGAEISIAKGRTAGKIEQVTVPSSLGKSAVTDEARGGAVAVAVERPDPSFVDDTHRPPPRRRKRWGTGAALLLIISVSAAGGYMLHQRYGVDEMVAEAGQALEVIDAQWSFMTSKIMTNDRTLESESQAPSATPETIQESPLPYRATGMAEATVAQTQQADYPSDPVVNTKPAPQPESAAEVADAAGLPEASVKETALPEASAVANTSSDEFFNALKSETPAEELAKAAPVEEITQARTSLEPADDKALAVPSLPKPVTEEITDATGLPEAPVKETALPEAWAVADTPGGEGVSTAKPAASQGSPEREVDAEAPSLPPPESVLPASPSAAETLAATDLEVYPAETAAADPLSVTASAAPELLTYIRNTYIRKGDEFFDLRDMASARLFYEAAVSAGHTKAMIAVGKTYDPLIMKQLALRGIYADPVKAAEWYLKALQAGDPEANNRLNGLRRWLAASPPLGEAEILALQRLLP